jgi:hypothetical protein
MRISLYVVCAAALLTSGAVAADEDAVVVDDDTDVSAPIELSAEQMDQITAGSLLLPNGNVVQDNFDNPAPNVDGYIAGFLGFCDGEGDAFCHPALNRRSDAAFVTAGKGPQVTPLGNDGPWVATVVSPVISICGGDFGPCTP